MKQNVGGVDRLVRLVLGVVLAFVGYSQMTWWLMVVGVVAFLTGVMRRCGAYALLGISTCKVEPASAEIPTL